MDPLELETPDDLMAMTDAIKETKQSRTWIENRVAVYKVGRIDMVSRSEVMAALEDWKTPKPKSKKGE